MKKIFIALIVSFLCAPLVFAAEGGIQISPLTYDFELKPGESKEATVTITNQNTEDLNYVMEVELFSNVTNDGAPSFAGVQKPEGVTTLADWVSFASGDKEGAIAPQGQKEIKFTISVPVGAEPGGHYAAVFAKQVKKTVEGKTELGVSSRVGTLVLVSIPGSVSRGAEIKSFTYPKFVWRGPVDFSMLISNIGSVHYDAPAQIEIKPLFGTTKIVDLGSHTIIPKNSRTYNGSWGSKYPFGYYSIKAIAKDGDGKEMIREGSMVAIPALVALPLIAIIIILMLVIRYVRRNFKITAKKTSREE